MFDNFYQLPRAGWRLLGTDGQNKGYAFKSTTGVIRAVVVKPGERIRIFGSGALGHTLTTNPNPVAVTLPTGAKHYCAAFGGTTRFIAGTRFSAKGAPPPASCPPLVD